tara:strand:+ start:7331 stop:8023 length:693 start_codon:yes stop_codon:yes gene_type:complete
VRIQIFFIITILINSCSYPELVRDELVYENDFEEMNLDNIDGGGFSIFNNSVVLGDFNNDGFDIHLENIGDHDYIFVSFDLYIHGTWDGNSNGFTDNDKADMWTMEIKPNMNIYSDQSSDIFSTTFSNSPCFSNYCLRQSYPQSFPDINNPKTGSFKTELDRLCQNDFFGGNTTLYKIEKVFKSRGSALVLRFYDELYQPNAIDKDGIGQMKCDESWSFDNVRIRALKYE